MKRIIFCITMILMFACMLPVVTACAETESQEFLIENGVLKEYMGAGGEIVIPKGVVVIAESAFSYDAKITGVTIPDTVKRIEDSAFYYCYHLRYVRMEDSVESIGENAFGECHRLRNVRLSAALRELPKRAWAYTGLHNLTIPQNILYMDVDCLGFSNKLEKVTVDPNCANKQAYQLTSVLRSADEYGEVGEVTIYSRLGEMDESTKAVLSKQARLEELALQAESLWLNPGEVYALAMNSDAKCDSWKSDNPSVAKVDRFGKITAKRPGKAVITAVLYGREYQCIVRVADLNELQEETPASKFEYEIRKGKIIITGLKDTSLTRVWIPKKIEGHTVENIGEAAFAFNETLMQVVIPDSVKEIGDRAFHGCSSLKEINLPEGIDRIGDGVFWNCENLNNIRIPEGVSSIEWNAFCGCVSLIEVNLPESLTVINPGAFWGCENLKHIRIPERVSSIGISAFEYCRSLEEVELPDNVESMFRDAFSNTAWLAQKEAEKGWIASGGTLYWVAKSSEGVFQIPEGITKIGEYAFYECENLTGVEIPASVTQICEGAFAGCSSLTEVNIAEGVLEHIGDEAFFGCSSLTHVILPECVGGIGYKAFSECTSLEKIKIPMRIAEVVGCAFSGCTSLTEVKIQEGVKYINDEAFSDCNRLVRVELPRSVFSISKKAFRGCNSELEFVVLKGSYAEEYAMNYQKKNPCKVTVKDDSDKFYFDYEETEEGNIRLKSVSQEYLKQIRESGSDTFTVPAAIDGKTVTEIGDAALAYLQGFKTLIIPEGVVRIEGKAFANCRELEKVVFPSTIRFIGEYAFQMSVLKEIVWSDDVSKITFGYMALGDREYGGEEWYDAQEEFTIVGSMLLKVVSEKKVLQIPEGITYIATGACENLTELEEVLIPEGVTEIGEQAFARCYNLKKVQLPDSLQTVGRWVFSDTPWLEEQELAIHNNILLGTGNADIVNCVIPKGVTIIADSAFSGLRKLKQVTLPESLKQIGEQAFAGCSSLNEITIPASVKEIGDGAFYGCSSLHKVKLPQGLENIGQEAFRNCKALERIELPDSVTALGKAAFFGCTGLKKVILPNKLTCLPDRIFEGCAIGEIVLPGTLVVIGESAFAGCGLERIVIPEGVERIGASVFEGCTCLSEVQLPDSLKRIGGAAFEKTPWLQGQEVAIHKNILIAAGNKQIKSYSVPKTITVICDRAFQDCKQLEEITLPGWLEYLGDAAFERCYRLKGSISIPYGVKRIGDYTFRDCKSLTKVLLWKSPQLEAIGAYAFDNCKGIKEMHIPESVQYIGSGALRNCKALKYLYLSESILCIEKDALYGCAKLKDINTVEESYAQSWAEENKASFTTE